MLYSVKIPLMKEQLPVQKKENPPAAITRRGLILGVTASLAGFGVTTELTLHRSDKSKSAKQSSDVEGVVTDIIDTVDKVAPLDIKQSLRDVKEQGIDIFSDFSSSPQE